MDRQTKRFLIRYKRQFETDKLVNASINEIKDRVCEVNKTIIKHHFNSVKESFNIEDEDLFRNPKFLYMRSNHAKGLLQGYQELAKYIARIYEHDLRYSRKQYFPRDWMRRHDDIVGRFNQYPKLEAFLNLLYNKKRFGVKEQTINLMKALTDKRHKGRYTYCVHKVNNKFYEEIANEIDFSVHSAKKYMQACGNAGILKCIRPVTGKGKARYSFWADGYYTKHGEYWRKRPLLIQDGPNGRRKILSFEL